MSRVRVLVGTRKGAFVLTSDATRERWDIGGPHFGGWEIYHLKGSPADPNRLYASQSSGWFGQLIQRSNDGGKTWEAVGNKFVYDGVPGTHLWYDGTSRPWEFARVWHLEPSLTDPDMVYAGVQDAALFRSMDGGQTWQESGELLPRLAAIHRAEQGGVLNPGVDHVRIGQRRFEMPDARELTGTRRAVVPQVSAGDAVVDELVPHRLPRLATVVGALDQLPEPAAGLRRIQPIRVSGRSLQVVDLPAPEVGATDVPPFARCVRRQDERALPCTDQDPYPAHSSSFLGFARSSQVSDVISGPGSQSTARPEAGGAGGT